MKAVVCTKYGPPEVLQIQEVEKPFPKDNEVLVKVYASTVSAADYKVRSFDIPTSIWLPVRLFLGLRKPRKSVLGMELSGKIESVGKDVKLFKKGDNVFAATLQTFGAYAEYKCLPEYGPIALKPTNATYEEAAAIPIGARTAFHYLKTIAQVKIGQKVLIYGASGSVGTYAVQLAKYFGAEVTGICSKANLDLVKSLGADKVIDYEKTDFENNFENYDIIFITVDKYPFKVCIAALNKNGYYLNIGRPLKNLSMIWTSISSSKKVIVGKNSPETVDVLTILKRLVEGGQLRIIIDREYSINQIVEAHKYADMGHKKGNVVITINEEVC
ncbi:NAD(P)-dependent alcohol dehydrogenase [Polaribacter sp. Hel1_85]|uniref:NAD(P)-dependent alcohol dehydrogenase n=1 Tax=Polaribacter sp. Hel1_85 TaxID=1250005 RepID=UPI00052C90B3|nr:NAD(P)-dependent alcohol dehydrogenase [Polaribacter sp. Hel1_85]KGL61714.1 NADPH:quinone oxidoreductase [Polaribacter sp. Hel1_85]